MTTPHDTQPRNRLSRASDFPREVLDLFDQYVHGVIDRRGFLEGASRHAVGGITAAGLLAALTPRFAAAQKVAPNDTRLHVETVTVEAPLGHGQIKGLLARPTPTPAHLPLVLVVHENRGLNPHIEDIARRLALDNFIAFAPDALTPLGGYPGTEDAARDLFAKLDAARTREDFVAAANWLQQLPGGNGRMGAVGFCWGGGMVNLLATRVPTLAAAVPFYGPAPNLADVPRIRAALLLHFAGNDSRINATWPPYEAALKAAGVRYEAHTYPHTEHGFHNDTTPRFDAEAAGMAWQRTLAFLNQWLR